MPEVVPTEGAESPESPEAAEAEETTTTPAPESDTTWKARLAGKDRALTQAKADAEQARKEAEELRRWKAEKEQADMSEVDRLNLRLQQLEAEKADFEARAKRLALQHEFPLAADVLGDAIGGLDAPSLAALEVRLKAQSEPPEPGVNPNNPPKTPRTGQPIASGKPGDAELVAALRGFGNPFQQDV